MDKAPTVSVIVPVYNVAEHVEACIASLRAQVMGDFECIVINDGSTDDSPELAAQAIADDPRFRLVTRPQGGLSAARNTGLDLVKTAYVAFVDSDDRLRPDYLQRLLWALEETGADWAACDVRSVNDAGWSRVQPAFRGKTPDGPFHSLPLDSWLDAIDHFPSAWNKLYRRDLIGDLRFVEGTLYEDHGFFYRLAARTDHLLYLPEPLYHQTRDREGQITGQDNDRVFEQFSVLDDIRQIMSGAKPDADAAFARLVPRLTCERSVVLRDVTRRRKFAAATADYLAAHDIVCDETLPELKPHWALEVNGELPLSVLLECNERPGDLSATLKALSRQYGPDHEIIAFCPDPGYMANVEPLLVDISNARLWQPEEGTEASFETALMQASGKVVAFLKAGQLPSAPALSAWTDAILNSGAPLCLSHFTPDPDGPGPVLLTPDDDGLVTVPEALDHPLCAMAFDRPSLIERLAKGVDGNFQSRALCGVAHAALVDWPAVRLSQARPTTDQEHATKSNALLLPEGRWQPLIAGGTRRLDFVADFSVKPHANVSLYEPETKRIVLHMSLRLETQKLVCNLMDGETWQAEEETPLTLGRARTGFSIIFDETGISVSVEDEIVWRSGPEHRYVGIDDAVVFDFYGALTKAEVLPVFGEARIGLDAQWQIRARVDTPAVTLRASGQQDPLPFWLEERNDDHLLSALLPGRFWRGTPPDHPLELTLDSDRATVGSLMVTREDLANRISVLGRIGDAPLDPFIAAHIVEHVHFGDLWPLLSDQGKGLATRLANELNVSTRMPPQMNGTRPVMPQEHPRNNTDEALQRFWAALGTGEDITDATKLVPMEGLNREEQGGLVIALTEFFCTRQADFDGLAALAAKHGLNIAARQAPDGDVWYASALLPWHLRAGRLTEVRRSLDMLTKAHAAWFMTPPLAWLLRTGLTEAWPDRDNLFFRILRVIESHEANAFSRVHCAELTDAIALLASSGDDMSPSVRSRLEHLCLRRYSLSSLFWAAIPDSTHLSHRLQAARDSFSAMARDTERYGALLQLESLGAAEARQHLRDLYGPSESPGPPETHDLLAAGRAPEPVALRYLSSGEATDASQAVHDAARRLLPDLHPETPRAPHFETQLRLGQLLGTPETRSMSVLPDNLLSDLEQLATARSLWVGIGLAIRLAKILPEKGKDQLLAWLTGVLTKADAKQLAAMGAAASVMSACHRLDAQTAKAITPLLPTLAQGALPTLPGRPKLPGPSGIHDALVLVFSCRPYLSTRIPPMREGWLAQLDALGIPYLVVVGDGDGRVDGDVLHLNAPDDYEGLPQKTLAALEWVNANTTVAHVVKVDDDCFVNVPVWFGALSYQKFDYYGRRLTRAPGQLDRGWHLEKSTTDRGRKELDKSPEPSEYADGGSGYALSRRAVGAALKAAKSAEGQRLTQVSFMEDKMLGDLLSLAGISLANEDYRVSIRRRTHRDAIPVGSWQNSFLASQTAPLSLVHLDRITDQAIAQDVASKPGLTPPRIWPTFHEPRIGYDSNALELLGPTSDLDAARQADVSVVAVMRDEMFMLPHFLKHYRDLGVTSFLIADNLSSDGTREYLAAQPDVCLFSVDTNYSQSQYGVAWQQAMLAAYRTGKWSLVADADELLVWQHPQTDTLSKLVADETRADAFRTFMLDMYPKGPLDQATFSTNGPFAEAPFVDIEPFRHAGAYTGPYSDQPGWVSALRHRLIPGSRPNLFTAQKLALLRYHPAMRLSAGLHFLGNTKIADQELFFAHFKYNAAFRQKAQTEVARGQHFNNAEEYRRYLALISEGRDVIYDPAISVRWTDCAFVAKRLSPISE